uniref:Ankyrin repeat domain-containing protein 34C-like n=1 Tax=Petromyzon marinus TaxID=7757 RepID=A0AAJ7XCW7_PETMA|nr:ankyrin repeat domain-containing protein 34C-like [Petromyzon marinus]
MMMMMKKEAPSAVARMASATPSATSDGDCSGGGDEDEAAAAASRPGAASPDGARTGGNPLLRAVQLGRLRLTRLLLDGGAYVNESNDRGETPLMVACLTRHADAQSASKARMVRYLLEKKADPNIQDKCGRTALMHACCARAGAEVASALLEGGADPSVEDRSCRSALVYAIHADEPSTLKVLLDACKAKGKEVIIINVTERLSLPGNKSAPRYLSLPGLPDASYDERPACASPSDVELSTSPSAARSSAPGEAEPRQPLHSEEAAAAVAAANAVSSSSSSSSRDADPFFSFARGAASNSVGSSAGAAGAAGAAGSGLAGEAPSPSRRRAAPPCRRGGGGGSAGRLSQLKRLQSEPWGLVAPSALVKAEDGGGGGDGGDGGGGGDRRSLDGRTGDGARAAGAHASNSHSPVTARPKRPLSRRQSVDAMVLAPPCEKAGGVTLLHPQPPPLQHHHQQQQQQQHQQLGRRNTTPVDWDESHAGTGGAHRPQHERASPCALPPHGALGASLRDLVHRRHLGVADHQEHDAETQAPPGPDSARCLLERRKHNTSPLTAPLTGSRESLHADSTSPLLLRRHQHPPLERRGSGTLLLDRISQTRPGFLPPLNVNPHPPIPDIGGSSGNINGGAGFAGPSRASAGRASSLAPGMAAHASLCLPARPVGLSLASSASASSLASASSSSAAAPHCSPRRGDAGGTAAPAAEGGGAVLASRQPKRPLVRRHSMQVEQMKQLGGFEGFCAK